jgi:hypothetical protein
MLIESEELKRFLEHMINDAQYGAPCAYKFVLEKIAELEQKHMEFEKASSIAIESYVINKKVTEEHNIPYSILSLLFGYTTYNPELVRTEFYVPHPEEKNGYKLVATIQGKASKEEADHMLRKLFKQSQLEFGENHERD